ncbi:MAG: ROK family protein [Lachnospiraceae bacterium]|nr:ROK family protein [Lachnospiraceae bacterium]
MSVLKLKPACKDYLWGGHRLAEEYGIEYDGEILAESWELSCHPDGPSVIVNGPFAGLTLEEYIEKEGKQVLGNHCRRFRDFPILIKFIDAKQNLSIQVHPDNKYALKNEGQYGKTEMWYIMDAGEGAFLYYGFKKEISKEEFAKRIEEDTLLEVLNAVPVHKGDVLFIESGTIHAAGPVRVGIDIGGTDTKIGLVDVNQQLLASTVIPTEAETGAEAVIKRIGEAVLALMEKEQIAMDQCIGVGVGVPGTVDRKRGTVVYSNNIRWEKVALAEQLSAYLPVPVQIANDADCAALGEAASGAARDYQDVVMLTLGTGIVNIVNIFRPQALLLGGGTAAQGEVLLAPIRDMVKTGCFGGVHGELPEIRTTELGNRAGMIGAANLL